MAAGICNNNRTILDFADRRAACRVSLSGHGLGNVEASGIGFIRDGQRVLGFLPTGLKKSRCAVPNRLPAGAIC